MARSKVSLAVSHSPGTRTRDRAGRGYTRCNDFAIKKDVGKAGTRLPFAFLPRLWKRGRSGMLTRTASPFTISRDIRFWVGQEGCGYSLSTGGMKGNGNQHPVVVPHPQWGLYQAAGLLGRAEFCLLARDSPARTAMELESHSVGFAAELTGDRETSCIAVDTSAHQLRHFLLLFQLLGVVSE